MQIQVTILDSRTVLLISQVGYFLKNLSCPGQEKKKDWQQQQKGYCLGVTEKQGIE